MLPLLLTASLAFALTLAAGPVAPAPVPAPAGTANRLRTPPDLSSTPADLLRYAAANLAGRDPAVRLAHQPTTTLPKGYAVGLAWRLDTTADGQARIFHSGRFPGYHTWVALYPSQDAAVVVLVNDTISQDQVTELGEQLWQALAMAGAAQ
jgi:D-alanyl-D-alanine-carboxypeptidase/D-alanyl-D-alanine-endopeptidase